MNFRDTSRTIRIVYLIVSGGIWNLQPQTVEAMQCYTKRAALNFINDFINDGSSVLVTMHAVAFNNNNTH